MIQIIGTDHKHQRVGNQCVGPDELLEVEKGQKLHFCNELERQFAQKRHALIGEEINHGCPSFASELAAKYGHEYLNVDMPLEERERRGIPRGYADSDMHAPDQVSEWHRLREVFMHEQVLKNRVGLQDVVIVCGLVHVHGLGKLFASSGEHVGITDLRNSSWFKQDWLPDCMKYM